MTTATAPPRSPVGSTPPSRRGARGLVVALVLVVLLAVGAFVVVRGGLGSTGGNEVVVFGDSITEQATDPLHQRFDGSFAVTVSGVSGARADQRVADAAAYASTTPGHVIINLGTNDVLQGTPTEETVAALTHIAEGFSGTDCVHLVTVNERMVDLSRPELHVGAVAINERIRALAAEQGWDVIDWASIVAESDQAGNPEGPLTLDTVHPTPVGQRHLLDAYQQALDRC